MHGKRFTQRLAMAARCLGWGRNALRRGTDRTENATLLAAIALALASVPLALSIGSTVYQHNLAISAEQTAAGHQVTAVLSQSTSSTVGMESVVNTMPAKARWTAPDGSRHTGTIEAPQQTATGATVHIWTDAHGAVVNVPLSPAQAWGRGALAVMLAMATSAVLLTVLVGVVRWRLDRVRIAGWEAEWRQIDPWRTRYTS